MAQLAAEHELLVTIEEGVLAGGFGTGVWEALSESDALADTRILRIGLPDRYVTHGTPAALYEEVGFTGRRIAERILSAVTERAVAG
jgi:1-deoxy-D-xylulose-5-phosphate synthase